MMNRKKKAGRRIFFCLSVMLLMAAGMAVYASPEKDARTIEIELKPRGNKQDSASQVKYNNNPAAYIEFTVFQNDYAQHPVWFRLRDAETGAETSEVQKLCGTGERFLEYTGDYGGYGTSYFVRMQTDSSSLYEAKLRGNWEP